MAGARPAMTERQWSLLVPIGLTDPEAASFRVYRAPGWHAGLRMIPELCGKTGIQSGFRRRRGDRDIARFRLIAEAGAARLGIVRLGLR